MNIIREHINEKFTENSDSIHDMGIGLKFQIEKRYKKVVEKLKTEYDNFSNESYLDLYLIYCADDPGLDENTKFMYINYLINSGANVNAIGGLAFRCSCKFNYPKIVKLFLDVGINVHTSNDDALYYATHYNNKDVVKLLKDYIQKEEAEKKLKESLNEKFTLDSDPIHDLGIGLKALRKFWKKKYAEIGNISMFTSYDKYFKNAGVNDHYKELCIMFLFIVLENLSREDCSIKDAVNNGYVYTKINYKKELENIDINDVKKDVKKALKKYFKTGDINENFINEAFTDDSDPVNDLGIGFPSLIENFIKKIFEYDHNRIWYTSDYGLTYRTLGSNVRLIDIRGDTIKICLYSDKYYNKNEKEIKKEKYVIELLKHSDLVQCIDKLIEKTPLKVIKSRNTQQYSHPYEFAFSILPQYIKFFKPKVYHPKDYL